MTKGRARAAERTARAVAEPPQRLDAETGRRADAANQLTRLMDVSSASPRPVRLLLEHWRPGPLGTVRMGARNGALMAEQFALAMSILWMAVTAVLIALEKLLPWRRTTTAIVTATPLLIGLAVATVPVLVPALMAPSGPMHDASTVEMPQ